LGQHGVSANDVARAYGIQKSQLVSLRRRGPQNRARGADACNRFLQDARKDIEALAWRLRNRLPEKHAVDRVVSRLVGSPSPASSKIAKVHDFFREHAAYLHAKPLLRDYGISQGQFSRWRTERQNPCNRSDSKLGFEQLFRDIASDPERLIEKYGDLHARRIWSAATDAPLRLQAAFELARTHHVGLAVKTALSALAMAAAGGSASAMQLIPGVLFLAHRHTTPARIAQILTRHIAPLLNDLARRPRPAESVARTAALGQLFAMLNEGGRHEHAAEIADRGWLRDLTTKPRAFEWCGPYLKRNEAHLLAWHGRKLGRACDAAEWAGQLGFYAPTPTSLPYTLCDIHLSCGDFFRAWEFVQQPYMRVRQSLAQGFRPGHEPQLSNFSGDFAIFFLGVQTRLRAFGRTYLATEFAEDLDYLERLLGLTGHSSRPKRMVRLACKPPAAQAPVPNELRTRLQRLEAACVKPSINPQLAGVIEKVVDRLRP
jgi:hypothetical protein